MTPGWCSGEFEREQRRTAASRALVLEAEPQQLRSSPRNACPRDRPERDRADPEDPRSSGRPRSPRRFASSRSSGGDALSSNTPYRLEGLDTQREQARRRADGLKTHRRPPAGGYGRSQPPVHEQANIAGQRSRGVLGDISARPRSRCSNVGCERALRWRRSASAGATGSTSSAVLDPRRAQLVRRVRRTRRRGSSAHGAKVLQPLVPVGAGPLHVLVDARRSAA